MANVMSNYAKNEMLKAYLNGETVKAMLLNETHTVNPDDDFVGDISANELSGTGYTRQTVTGSTFTEDDSGDDAAWDIDDVTFSGIDAGTIDTFCLYIERTNDADSEIILQVDTASGLPKTTNGSDIQFNVNEILELV